MMAVAVEMGAELNFERLFCDKVPSTWLPGQRTIWLACIEPLKRPRTTTSLRQNFDRGLGYGFGNHEA